MSDALDLLPEEPEPRRRGGPSPQFDPRFADATPSGGGREAPSGGVAPGPDTLPCAAHPQVLTRTTCASCGLGVCGRCRVLKGGRALCPACRPADEWRVPLGLRLALWGGALLLAITGGHRWLRGPGLAFPDGAAVVPLWPGGPRWEQLRAWDAAFDQARSMVGIGLLLIGLLSSRGPQGQTWAVVWRVLLACLLCGAALAAGSDPVWALLRPHLPF